MGSPISVICTLFEKDYHYGLAAMINSLHISNFQGEIYAGYRGKLPPWVTGTDVDAAGNASFIVTDSINVYFAYQHTDEMLANIKPELIQQVWNHYGTALNAVYYIDCDIIIKAKWHHFEDWANYGVALCEDMNSPLSTSNMLRKQWQSYYSDFGIDYKPKDNIYVNGGFVGINRKYNGFASRWQEMQEYMKLNTGRQDKIGIADRWNMFHFMDQDALNVTKDLVDDVCILGKEAMDFGRFGHVMSHAAGRRKPWHKAYLTEVITTGARPSFTDKIFWNYASHPVQLYSNRQVRWKRFTVKLASLIGRFFTRT